MVRIKQGFIPGELGRKPGYQADESGTEVQDQEPVTQTGRQGEVTVKNWNARSEWNWALELGLLQGLKPDQLIRIITAHVPSSDCDIIVTGLVLGFGIFKKAPSGVQPGLGALGYSKPLWKG